MKRPMFDDVDVVKIAPKSPKIAPKSMVFDPVFDMVFEGPLQCFICYRLVLGWLYNRVVTWFVSRPSKLVMVLISP